MATSTLATEEVYPQHATRVPRTSDASQLMLSFGTYWKPSSPMAWLCFNETQLCELYSRVLVSCNISTILLCIHGHTLGSWNVFIWRTEGNTRVCINTVGRSYVWATGSHANTLQGDSEFKDTLVIRHCTWSTSCKLLKRGHLFCWWFQKRHECWLWLLPRQLEFPTMTRDSVLKYITFSQTGTVLTWVPWGPGPHSCTNQSRRDNVHGRDTYWALEEVGNVLLNQQSLSCWTIVWEGLRRGGGRRGRKRGGKLAPELWESW